MRVVALYRVSTERQAEQGSSLDAQSRRFHELAKQHNWQIVAEFRGCESATQASVDREVLQAVLACVRRDAPDAIYVHEQSRLTRGDELEVALLMRELRERRTKIIVAGVIRDLGSIDERFMVGIQSLVDRAESERIKERVSRGKREKARQGKRVSGAPPFGYRNPAPGNPQRGILQIVESEAVIVRRVFAAYLAGTSIRGIAAMLTAEGVASPNGGSWGKSTVRRMLQNPAYQGTSASYVWKRVQKRNFRLNLHSTDAVLVADAHMPIVSASDWQRAQQCGKVLPTPRPRLLTGMLRLNGRPAVSDTNRQVRYYRAIDGPSRPWVQADELDAQVWEAFQSVLRDPKVVLACLADDPNQRQSMSDERANCVNQLAKLQRRQSRLGEMRADGELDKPTYAGLLSACNENIASLERRVADISVRLAAFDPDRVTRAITAIRSIVVRADRIPTQDRRRLLAACLSTISIEVCRESTPQARDLRCRYQPGERYMVWRPKQVSFEFAGSGRPDAAGGLGTTCLCWVPLAVARR